MDLVLLNGGRLDITISLITRYISEAVFTISMILFLLHYDLLPQSLQMFAQLLQAPQDDANAILKERFPAPRLVICDQHGSQVSNLVLYD